MMDKDKHLSKLFDELTVAKKNNLPLFKSENYSYQCVGKTGKGSFGIVYRAVQSTTNRVVAIKRVLQDPKFKNRELQIMKMINHGNVVEMVDNFYQKVNSETYLNLVLGYMPENLYELCSDYAKRQEKMPFLLVKIFTYQLCRSLAYIHQLGICHRDIKPQNLLINRDTNELRLCDFGSAKMLVPGEPNVSYICSRYYRAPELIFGATEYTNAIDMWSTGCVMSEMLISSPLFAGENSLDQLVEIIKVLGTPTREQVKSMKKDYKEFPLIPSHPWEEIFPPGTPSDAIDVASKMLVYVPTQRLKPLEVCIHPFFDELRVPNGGHKFTIPPLFNFTEEELKAAKEQNLLDKLQPNKETQTKPQPNSETQDPHPTELPNKIHS